MTKWVYCFWSKLKGQSSKRGEVRLGDNSKLGLGLGLGLRIVFKYYFNGSHESKNVNVNLLIYQSAVTSVLFRSVFPSPVEVWHVK